MAASDTVVNAFLSMCETDYRGALRSLVTAGNPQMSEDEIRERVRLQAEYQPQETAVARLRAWVEDDALEAARASGDRLWLLCAENTGGGWFPAGREAAQALAPALPRRARRGDRGRDRQPARPDRGGRSPGDRPASRGARLSNGQARAAGRSRAPLGGAGRGPAGRAGSLLVRDIPASTKACSRTSPAITAW